MMMMMMMMMMLMMMMNYYCYYSSECLEQGSDSGDHFAHKMKDEEIDEA